MRILIAVVAAITAFYLIREFLAVVAEHVTLLQPWVIHVAAVMAVLVAVGAERAVLRAEKGHRPEP